MNGERILDRAIVVFAVVWFVCASILLLVTIGMLIVEVMT